MKEIMLPDNVRELILSAVKRGRYSLLLGAGFSATSFSRNGERLPIGNALAVELAKEFKLESYYPLQQLSGAIDTKDLNKFFQMRFSDCRAAEGISLISSFVWKSIYTFNVDDVLEDCYRRAGTLQTSRNRTFHHVYSTPDDIKEVNVVYLHGSVLYPEHGYVFSPEEYGGVAAEDSTWFKVAADQLLADPFIIIGCSLAETDLEYYIKRRKGVAVGEQQIAPSLYVSREMDAVKLKICERYGFIPIKASGDAFFSELLAHVGKPLSPLELVLPNKAAGIFSSQPKEADLRVFYRQWIQVEPDELPDRGSSESDIQLLRGTEPQWYQIKRGDDILRSTTQQLVREISDWVGSSTRDYKLRLLLGTPGEGKSTLLMRSAFELARSGVRVFFYSANERMLAEPAGAVFEKAEKPVVLFVDRVWEHGHQLDALLRYLRSKNTPFFVVAAERSFRVKQLRDALVEPSISELEIPPLSQGEAHALVEKMRVAGLLGLNAKKSDSELSRNLRNHGLFTGIVQLNSSASHLKKFVSDELAHCDEVSRKTYAFVSLAHSCGYPIKLALIQRGLKFSVGEITRRMLNDLKGLVVRLPPIGEYWEARHRIIAEAVVDGLNKRERFETFVALAKALAPYVNRETVIKGIPEAKLAARLLDYDGMVEPNLGQETESFYKAIRTEWAWNSRYWEQLALLKMHHDLPTAITYAEQAVGIEEHFVTLTTLAKVRFRMAQVQSGTSVGERFLRDAISAVDQAVANTNRWRRRDVHSYDVGLRGIIDYYRALKGRKTFSIGPDIRAAGDRYSQEAKQLFRQEEQRRLERDWAEVKAAAQS